MTMADDDDKKESEEVKQLDIADEAKEYREKLEACEKARDEYLNGWKRAKADLINYQKDEAKRFAEIIRLSAADLLGDFIPVLDNFDLAISVLEKEAKSAGPPEFSQGESSRAGVLRGIYMIRTQIEDVLKKRGLERMAVTVGNKFDPNIHESIG